MISLRRLVSFVVLTFSVLFSTLAVGQSVSPTSMSYVRAITLDHRQVANRDQTDFPVLISGTFDYLKSAANGGKVQNTNGYDIVFTSDAAGTQVLDYEIDSYNPATGKAAYWVRIPMLSHTADTPLYMWYGNASVVASQENKPGVWKNGYAAVYHFGSTTLSAADSSSNGNNGTSTGVSAATGVLGLAGSFDGTGNTYFRVPSSTSYKPASALTTEAWVQVKSITSWGRIFSLDFNANGSWGAPYNSFSFGFYGSSAQPYFGIVNGTTLYGAYPSSGISLNTWMHIVGTYDGAALTVYENGSQVTSTAQTGTINYGTSKDLAIGVRSAYTPGEALNGLIDVTCSPKTAHNRV